MNTSFRTTASVIAVTIAALAAPSLAHAKRMGGGKSLPSTRPQPSPQHLHPQLLPSLLLLPPPQVLLQPPQHLLPPPLLLHPQALA